jgi:hypothetical protein
MPTRFHDGLPDLGGNGYDARPPARFLVLGRDGRLLYRTTAQHTAEAFRDRWVLLGNPRPRIVAGMES